MRIAELPLGDLPPSEASIEVTQLAYDRRREKSNRPFFYVRGYIIDRHASAAHPTSRQSKATGGWSVTWVIARLPGFESCGN